MSAAVGAGTARSSSSSAVSTRTPVGCARGVAHDAAARRVGRGRGDAGRGKPAGVGEHGVAVHAPQQHRVVRRPPRRACALVGKRLLRPAVLVPPAAQHPGARRELGGRLPHPRHDLVEARRVAAGPPARGPRRSRRGGRGSRSSPGRRARRRGPPPRPPTRRHGAASAGRHQRDDAPVVDRDLEPLRSAGRCTTPPVSRPVAARGVGAGGARQRDQRHDTPSGRSTTATVAARRRRGNGERLSLAELPRRLPCPKRPITRRDLIATTAKAAAVAAAVGPALAQAAQRRRRPRAPSPSPR